MSGFSFGDVGDLLTDDEDIKACIISCPAFPLPIKSTGNHMSGFR
jgi:hypothetical protein